jgi:hypothetical protein
MNTFKSKFFILILLSIFWGLNQNIAKSIANPVPVYISELGGFIPKNDYTCSMPNASVIIEINATDPFSHFDLEFRGNYTLYNPNETLNLTIAAPFSSHIFGPNSTCEIKINESLIPFYVIEYQRGDTYSWDDYISISQRNLIICDITLPMNKPITLEYYFKTYINISLNDIGYLEFHYDIGTASVWSGTISERIEFIVHGQLPDKYLNTTFLTILDNPDGKSYIWEWKDVSFPTGYLSVYIFYYGNYEYNYYGESISFGNYYLLFLLLGVVTLVLLQKRLSSERNFSSC